MSLTLNFAPFILVQSSDGPGQDRKDRRERVKGEQRERRGERDGESDSCVDAGETEYFKRK